MSIINGINIWKFYSKDWDYSECKGSLFVFDKNIDCEETVCHVDGFNKFHKAHLISAAPNLYTALGVMVVKYKNDENGERARKFALAALAKANGETK